MRFVDEFRSPALAGPALEQLRRFTGRPLTVMEFCGTHTMAIARYGLRSILPPELHLLSGPGCPVCVTSPGYIDAAVGLSREKGVILTSFGDMLRVPGTAGSLMQAKAEGKDIRVVYSPLDAVRLAQHNPRNHIVFLGVGFETTAPVVGLSILEAARLGLDNYSVFSAHKLVLPALQLLAADTGLQLHGLLCPGHIAAVTGVEPFRLVAELSGIPAVIAGFEVLDIIQGLLKLTHLVQKGSRQVSNSYFRVVRPEGNGKALEVMARVFSVGTGWWRGLGPIPQSGLTIRDEYCHYDSGRIFGLPPMKNTENESCHCGEVLTGRKIPPECPGFGTICTPQHPQGACMVSGEGACAAYYHYGSN